MLLGDDRQIGGGERDWNLYSLSSSRRLGGRDAQACVPIEFMTTLCVEVLTLTAGVVALTRFKIFLVIHHIPIGVGSSHVLQPVYFVL